ncbi:MAG TPA: DUF2589 domain-containing protein [Phycisphaerae bacterium]|nr:DUF2589 domain-containing protein [Phycisphaerae bacterium]
MSWWPFGDSGKKGDDGGGAPEPHPPSVSEHTLADIVRGIQHAVNAAQELTEQHHIRTLERYFDDEGNAITQRILMPDGVHCIDLPLVTAIPPNGLALSEMTVEMAVRIDNSVRKKAAARDVETHLTRTSFEVSFAPRAGDRAPQKVSGGGSAVDVSMKFVAGDTPEGVARVMEYFTHALVPKVIATGKPVSSTDPPEPEGGPPGPTPTLPPAPGPPDSPDMTADESS